MNPSSPHVLIITGPTASGKTDLSLEVASRINSEIINADVGQFYTSLSVGVAKPDWKNSKVEHHLFDIIDRPQDLSVSYYRKLVLEHVEQIVKRGNLPIIVGGSLFYIKSLFYPPTELDYEKKEQFSRLNSSRDEKEKKELWERLQKIDPKRASEIHPSDYYRTSRALEIWQSTGQLPSEIKPTYKPFFSSTLFFLDPEQKLLYERINKRARMMILAEDEKNWIEECRSLKGTDWEEFLKKKGLIGYEDIFHWMALGEKKEHLEQLIETIQIKTRQYAKRQKTFWKSFSRQLELQKDEEFSTKCTEVKITQKDQAAYQEELVKRIILELKNML